MPVILRLLIPLIAGILLAYFFELHLPFWIIFSLTLLLTGTFFVTQKRILNTGWLIGSMVSFLFLFLGIYLEKASKSFTEPAYFTNHPSTDSTEFFQLRLADYPQPSGDWIKFKTEILAFNGQPASGSAQVYLERDSISETLVYGDLLYANCHFFKTNGPSNPHEFDYRGYLNHQDIYHQAFVKQSHWIKFGNDANPLLSLVYKTRSSCSEIIDNSGMQPENRAVCKALLLGDKAMISDELMLSYSASGTLHVLAVSGLHVGIVMLILSFVLQPLKRLKKGKLLFLIFALAGIWFYTLLTGFSPSILRAAVMFSFVLVGNEMQRDTAIYQSLFVSAFILILFDPHIIFQVGFLLSYLAVFGIVFFHPKIYKLLYFKYKIADKSWQLISVSIAAQLATLPLSLYCFHQFPTYFLLANLIVIPVSFIILILGIAALVLYAVPYAGNFLFYVMDWLITLMNEGVRLVEKLPYAVLDGLLIQWIDALLLFSIIFGFAFTLLQRSFKILYTTLALSTILLISFAYQKLHRSENQLAVFYSVKNEVIFDVIQGDQITCFATASSLKDDKKLHFHVYPNRLQSSGKTAASQTYFLHDSTGIISIADKRVLFLNQSKAEQFYTQLFPAADLLYLYDASFIQQGIVDHLSSQKIPVLTGTNVSYKLKAYLEKSIGTNYVYDLTKKGAAVFNLTSLPN